MLLPYNTFAKILDGNFGGYILWLLLLVRTIYGLDFAVLRSYPAIGEGIDLIATLFNKNIRLPLTNYCNKSLYIRWTEYNS